MTQSPPILKSRDTEAGSVISSRPNAKNLGLASAVLSTTETFAQSIAGIGPSISPAITVALVFGMAGGAAWLAYATATGIMMLTAITLSVFASRQSSAGSLYSYAKDAGGPLAGFTTGWAMLLAYVLGVAGGSVQFAIFAGAFLQSIGISGVSPLLLAAVNLLGTTIIACKNVKLSAEFMLWMEILSIGIILILVEQTLAHNGFHIDLRQLHLTGASPRGFGMGLVLALLAFVGFESSTSLGTEADKPLEKIPKTLTYSVVLCGAFFVITTYAIVQGFADSSIDLSTCTTPLVVLSDKLNMHWLAVLTTLGAAASLFAATIASNTAAARIMLTMSDEGYLHKRLKTVHAKNQNPTTAVLTVAALALLAIAFLFGFNSKPLDVVGWLGTIATYSFILAYSTISALMPGYLKKRGELKGHHITLSILATITMAAALFATLSPLPPAPYCWLPLFCLVYFAAGGLHFLTRRLLTN